MDEPRPEHEKLLARSADRDLIQAFMDWLYDTERLVISDRLQCDHWISSDGEKGDLIGRFLGVDPKAFRAEKDALVAALQQRARERYDG